jgi:hypothetical protein
MELPPTAGTATPRLEDLRALAEISVLRLPTRDAESRRAERVRTVLAATTELARALTAHSRSLLVDRHVSPESGDLGGAAEELHEALTRHAELVRSIVDEYRWLVDPDGTPAVVVTGDAFLTTPPLPARTDVMAGRDV